MSSKCRSSQTGNLLATKKVCNEKDEWEMFTEMRCGIRKKKVGMYNQNSFLEYEYII